MFIFERRKEERKNLYKIGTDYADYTDFILSLRNRKLKPCNPRNPCLKTLVNHLEAQIGDESLGHTDAFGCLVVLQQGSYNAGQSQSRAVQSVAQFGLLLGSAVTALQAVGLIIVEVADRADLQSALLGLAIYLEVEAGGGSEAHIASAQMQDAVRQL